MTDALLLHPAPELLAALPMPYARRHLVLPLTRNADAITVGMADPTALHLLDDLRFLYQATIQPRRVAADVLRVAISRAYDDAARPAAAAIDAIDDVDPTDLARVLDEPTDLLEAGDETPVIRFVNALLAEAVKAGASDLHIEPYERALQVRLRIDGLLHDLLSPPPGLHAAIVSRVKVMAGLDIAERRLPQDGRLQVRVGGRDIDVRVSIVPTASGERVVLRLLDRATAARSLNDLGLASALATVLDGVLAESHGIVLITGPTGSGKTTTLYALLRRLAAGQRNVMTIEDPIEYQLAGIAQMAVQPRIGLTFAAGLRAILRQDPDILLVGEIRDRETCEIALQAALTGHLVFATLHTNDAPSAVTRLLDMQVEPYLIASSVRMIVAQRLVRRICSSCGGPGCDGCRQTGYRGRLGLHELLTIDDDARALIMARADASTLRRQAIAAGMVPLQIDGHAKVVAGLTTAMEVARATRDEH